jgi:hypothetical protein
MKTGVLESSIAHLLIGTCLPSCTGASEEKGRDATRACSNDEIEEIGSFDFYCLLGLESFRKCDGHLSTTIQMKTGEQRSRMPPPSRANAKRSLVRSTPSRVVSHRIRLRGEHSIQLGGRERAMP